MAFLSSLRFRLSSLVWLGTGLVAFACGSDDEEPVSGSSGPPCLEIFGVSPGNNRLWAAPFENRCAVSGYEPTPGDDGSPLEMGCDLRLVVSITPANWTLRPPGRCDGTPQCGFVRAELRRDGEVVASAEVASSGIALSIPDAPLPGTYTLRTELHNDGGSVNTSPNAVDEQELELLPPAACDGEPPPGGAGGQAGAAGAGGAGGEVSASGGAGQSGAPSASGAGGDDAAGAGGIGAAGANGGGAGDAFGGGANDGGAAGASAGGAGGA